MQTVIREKYNM
jgi:hypothetical protein